MVSGLRAGFSMELHNSFWASFLNGLGSLLHLTQPFNHGPMAWKLPIPPMYPVIAYFAFSASFPCSHAQMTLNSWFKNLPHTSYELPRSIFHGLSHLKGVENKDFPICLNPGTLAPKHYQTKLSFSVVSFSPQLLRVFVSQPFEDVK